MRAYTIAVQWSAGNERPPRRPARGLWRLLRTRRRAGRGAGAVRDPCARGLRYTVTGDSAAVELLLHGEQVSERELQRRVRRGGAATRGLFCVESIEIARCPEWRS